MRKMYASNAERQRAYRARKKTPNRGEPVTTRYQYKNGWIEAGPIIRVLKKWIAEQDVPRGHQREPKAFDSILGSIAQLAHWTGIKHDTLYGYTAKPHKWMEFDLADKIICHTYGPLMWRSDPELEALYQGFDFTGLDEKVPTTRAA